MGTNQILAAADDSITDLVLDDSRQTDFGFPPGPGVVLYLATLNLEERYCAIWRATRHDGGSRNAWMGARRVLMGMAMSSRALGYPTLANDQMDLAGLADHLAYSS